MARGSGWVPNQHGAWAMLAVPAVVGSVLQGRDHGWSPWSLVLVLAAVSGYFAFHAASLWLRSRRKPRYLPPLRTYSAVALLSGLVALLMGTGWVWAWWVLPAAAVLVGIGLWEAAHRRDRSLLAGIVAVLAAQLLVPALTMFGSCPGCAQLQERVPASVVDLAWAACTAYFVGTVLVVKTMIRERGSRGYLAASVGYHLACTVAFLLLGHLALGLFFGVGTVRAMALPWLASRGLRVRPAQVGAVEIVLSVALTVLLVA